MNELTQQGRLLAMAKGEPADSIDVEVGHRIRTRREERRISQPQLAAKLGITYQQVQKYENGRNRVSASRLQAVARILDVSADYFFGDSPQAAYKAEALEEDILAFLATSDGRRLNRAFGRIKDPMLRRRVVKLVRLLIND